jgi:hypothetical protein
MCFHGVTCAAVVIIGAGVMAYAAYRWMKARKT